MISQETIKIMHELSAIDGIASNERNISEYLQQQYVELADEVIYDNLGSIYAIKKSNAKHPKRVMISGHMDEAGLIITKFLENGLLQALVLGTVAENSLLGATVRVSNLEQEGFTGTILATKKDGKVLNKNGEVIIDLGFLTKENLQSSGLQLGDTLSFVSEFRQTNAGAIYMRNWNGRYAPILGLEILQMFKDIDLPFDLYIGCTVQEQVGLRGIQTATNLVQPDLAIVLDTEQSFDYQVDADDRIGVLGKGVLLTYYDKTVLPNRLLIQTFRDICDQNQIAYQYYYSLTDSEAGWVNKLRTGCPTLLVDIPVRNMNTPQSLVATTDYEAAKQGLYYFLNNLDEKQIIDFKEENR